MVRMQPYEIKIKLLVTCHKNDGFCRKKNLSFKVIKSPARRQGLKHQGLGLLGNRLNRAGKPRCASIGHIKQSMLTS